MERGTVKVRKNILTLSNQKDETEGESLGGHQGTPIAVCSEERKNPKGWPCRASQEATAGLGNVGHISCRNQTAGEAGKSTNIQCPEPPELQSYLSASET